MVNHFWTGLVAVAVAALMWTTGLFCLNFYHYLSLSKTTHPKQISWQVVRKKNDFLYNAQYTFEVGGQTYQGAHTFKRPTFPNEMAAHMVMQHWQSQAWDVYFNPSNPTKCSMQKEFPLNQLSRTGLCLALLIYFAMLRRYTLLRRA